ncbi:hypothetical protein KBZ07_07920 [Cyanobium sp. BA20m-14]|uniref:hypothetical protein n=1 Tax=Cyanobium sp. BA20m-14 TaxID=2823703 RepID=UPI0020CDEF85|nr:hypothetical protein [Cyanobium sp. BA20m-14]MCP9913333.1 hypothetical protein [Cyanobium sp. BA20m-14]
MDVTSSPQPHELRNGYNCSESMPSTVSEPSRAQLDNPRDVYKLIEKLTEEGKAESVAGWSIDVHKLQLAVELLKDVDLSDD